MRTKLTALAVTLAMGASALLMTASTADAQRRHGGYYGHQGGYYGGGYRHRGYNRGYNNGGALLGGLAAGAIIGGALAAQPRYYDRGYGYTDGRDVQYCMSRFKSYDVNSGTYLGYDGNRHACP